MFAEDTEDQVSLNDMVEDVLKGRIEFSRNGLLINCLIYNECLPFAKAEALAAYYFGLPACDSADSDEAECIRLRSMPVTLCGRRDATSDALAEWLGLVHYDDIDVLLGHPNLSDTTLDAVASRCSIDVIQTALTMASFPKERHSSLAASSYPSLRAATAAATSDPHIIKKLAADPEGWVRGRRQYQW